jgi:hypothetical protein
MLYLPESAFLAMSTKISGGIRLDAKNGDIKDYIIGYIRKKNGVSTITEKNGKLYFLFPKENKIFVIDKKKKFASKKEAE